MTHTTVKVSDDPVLVLERIQKEGWGDGLPVIPPTRDRLDAMLAAVDLPSDEVLGIVPPARAEATVDGVAINAILAGCAPEHLPVVIAATRAMCDERFNLYGMQATTNPVAVAGFVNGPVVDELGFNASWNCLGQGNRSNAAVGRAIRFVLMNLGGGRPGDLDRATHGQPGKYAFFFAENEPENPWSPYHADLGFDPGTSTVTMIGVAGTTNFLECTEEPDDMLSVFARGMQVPAGNDYIFCGQPFVVLSPEHAEVLSRYSKGEVQEALWERSKLPVSAFSKGVAKYWLRPTWEPILGPLDDDSPIPIAQEPSDVRIVVAGGPSIHTQYLPTFGDTRSVTVPVVR